MFFSVKCTKPSRYTQCFTHWAVKIWRWLPVTRSDQVNYDWIISRYFKGRHGFFAVPWQFRLMCHRSVLCVTLSKHFNWKRFSFFCPSFFDGTAGDGANRPFDAVLWHLTTLFHGLLKRKSEQRTTSILNHSRWWRNRAGWGQGARSITYSRDASQPAKSRVWISPQKGILYPLIDLR